APGQGRTHRRPRLPDRRTRPGPGAAGARRRRDLPRALLGRDRGRGPRRPPPLRLRPRERRRRDAGPAGRGTGGHEPSSAAPGRGAEDAAVRSGFVGLGGRANVGKSTLVNTIVGSHVVIVSNRPQTTRRAIRGVATDPEAERQLILVDLPGV